MSSKHPHPGRTIAIFLLVIAAMFGGMAALKTWTPKLGLDLRGGTTITLTSKEARPDGNSMQLARGIIQRRVDALGVGETAVSLQGDRQIFIEVPNVQQDDLVRLVGTTAQLTLRQVLIATAASPAANPSDNGSAGAEVGLPTAPAKPTAAPTTPSAGASPSTGASAGASAPASPGASPSAPAEANAEALIEKRLAYTPTAEDMKALEDYKCGGKVSQDPDPAKAMVTCDKLKTAKYLLGPVVLEGRKLKSATAGVPQNQLNWQVNLTLDGEGATEFGHITRRMFSQPQPKNQLAIVIDGDVQSAPVIKTEINGGGAEISGSFNQQSATELANVLKFGALPIAFEVSEVNNISATLGADQLRGGIIAGLIGLALVVLYGFLYYRGLGVIVVLSLAIAGTMTYAMLVLLGVSMDYALNLPGIAGAIVAIGVTADSFIIYFERIRDEVREGRSLRTAIQTGWQKARSTIVVADAVSLLSALVLFFLAIGAVKGFAFTLGLTTLIDLAIVFFFTYPLMTLLGKTKFYGEGHKLSGLDAAHMGLDEGADVAAPTALRRKAPSPKVRRAETKDGKDDVAADATADEKMEA